MLYNYFLERKYNIKLHKIKNNYNIICYDQKSIKKFKNIIDNKRMLGITRKIKMYKKILYYIRCKNKKQYIKDNLNEE